MKTEIPRLFILFQPHYGVSAGPSEESMFSANVAFKSLKSNLGKCHHHNPHSRGVATSKLVGD
jgi:hypothetical protein